jgi:hypothetical protein
MGREHLGNRDMNGRIILKYIITYRWFCVTNKTGFWIWWSNLLDLYTTGYNSSQITIWHTVIFRLDTPRELFWLPTELNFTTPLYYLVLLQFFWLCPSYNSSARTPRKTLSCQECLFIGPLHSSYCWECNFGNVFTEPFHSNGHMRHTILKE